MNFWKNALFWGNARFWALGDIRWVIPPPGHWGLIATSYSQPILLWYSFESSLLNQNRTIPLPTNMRNACQHLPYTLITVVFITTYPEKGDFCLLMSDFLPLRQETITLLYTVIIVLLMILGISCHVPYQNCSYLLFDFQYSYRNSRLMHLNVVVHKRRTSKFCSLFSQEHHFHIYWFIRNITMK